MLDLPGRNFTVCGDWALWVTDNGVGMPEELGDAKPGLGINIIQALAKQLGARITVLDAAPGTAILLEHAKPDRGEAIDSGPVTPAV